MSIKSFVRKKLTLYWDYRYKRRLLKYRLNYQDWLKTVESKEDHPSSIQKESDFILLSFGRGMWAPNAWQLLMLYRERHPDTLLIYGDEDVQNQKGFCNPWFKPDWSPDTFLYRDYFGDAVCVKKELYEKLTDTEKRDPLLCHKRLVELAGGHKRGCKTIGHIEGILFHREGTWEATCEDTWNPPKKLQDMHFDHTLVSVIIPSKDNVSVLQQCLLTIQENVTSVPYEILIIDNGSCQHAKLQLTEYVEKINQELTTKAPLRSIQYFYEPMEFNFSKMCNAGAERASGNVLLFLNDDIEAVKSGWMEQMAAKAVLPWVGAVGIKLWYPDSDRIQHAGITNISIGPVHKLQFLKDNKCYYDCRNRGQWNVLAVTGACMMMRKDIFLEAGKFAEEMHVAFNDVDLCFTLYELGYSNVVINSCHLLHHESLSRGSDDSEEKMKRLMKEREILYKRHPKLENTDPYYHIWLNQTGLDTRIVPAYLEGNQKYDKADFKPLGAEVGIKKTDCLLLRIEYADTKWIQGYAVVLGSDNACYEKKLVFKSKSSPEKVYVLDVEEQYRSDIAENMPDQIHIALCGFKTEFASSLPKGEYRIGAMAKDRISGSVLVNYSNRSICF